MIDAPLRLHSERVAPDWVDYNGHMNVAYYVLAFDHATDAFFDFVGVGQDYMRERKHTMFVLEAHVTYQRELVEADPISMTTQLLGFDHKRLHYFHRMYRTGEDYLAATIELMAIHVDPGARRSSSFPDDITARLEKIAASHAGLPRPPEAGRVMSLRPRSEGTPTA